VATSAHHGDAGAPPARGPNASGGVPREIVKAVPAPCNSANTDAAGPPMPEDAAPVGASWGETG
jgi:hypothetical protein